MSYKTNEDTNDNNEGDNAKGEDDNDNDEIDKDVIRIGKDSGSAIEVNLNNQWNTDMDHYSAQEEHTGYSFSTTTSKFTAQGERERCNFSNTGSKLTNVRKFTIYKDGDMTLEENSTQTAGHSLSYFLNNDQEEPLVSTSSHWTKELGKNIDFISLLQRPSEEYKTEIKAACSKLSKNILDIYETSLKKEIQTDYIKRDQFCYCLKILRHFQILETYFKIYYEQNKGQTIKTNVIRSIIKSGKGHNQHLKLIEIQTNNLVNTNEGRRLYEKYKKKCKREKYESLRNLYIGMNRKNDLLENEINDEKDEEDEERIDLLF
ncbi:hypothetical protein GLOIN_2v1790432 [Rhizophagus clarus]|uniref:Uncharacterized protein n=1 Tax=Rhizophagus clarus TaxID=94130 RepID=A0A8H3KR63_9GLOM|nr:hypothetical protein GLOIN_2v1790432 [Rhizophagus clarus]